MKKTMKSVFMMLAACAMCFSFSACGGDDDPWSDLLNGTIINGGGGTTTTSSATLDGTKISFAKPQKASEGDNVMIILATSNNSHNLVINLDEDLIGKTVDVSVPNEDDLWNASFTVNGSSVFNYWSSAILQTGQFQEGSTIKCSYTKSTMTISYKLIYKDSEKNSHTLQGSYSGAYYDLDKYLK